MRLRDAEKLSWGTIVKPTKAAIRGGVEYRNGIFVGIGKDGTTMNVIVVGTAYPRQFHPSFWGVK